MAGDRKARDFNIFDYSEYKRYLRDLPERQAGGGRGFRTALAQAVKVQTAYVSQVLNGAAQFSLEQADALNRFLGHSRDESDYFILLVEFARAGTPSLRQYFRDKLSQLQEKRLVLKDRLEVKQVLSLTDQALYYSAWYFAAVHILVTIPEFQTREAIASYLQLSAPRVTEVLEFLLSVGLVVEEGGRYRIGTARIHLGADSPMISKHHTNWRMRAIQSLESRNANEQLHYSSVVSISREDVLRIKTRLVNEIEESKKVIRASKEEVLHCFSLDFFEI